MAHNNGSWQSVLSSCPAFVINMDKCKDRWDKATVRISDAGFQNVHRFRGVDATTDDLALAWQQHGSPNFDPYDTEFVTYKGKQGCMLSHLNLWKNEIIDKKLPMAVVFEDDVCFHSVWHQLAPRYWDATPKEFDVLYIGSQIDWYIDGHIIKTPVFCTHAYVITLQGATLLYDTLLKDPAGVRTIDCMLIDHMKRHVFRKVTCPFDWYVWNGMPFPEKDALADPHWAKRNTGLVFQDVSLGTYVRPWHNDT